LLNNPFTPSNIASAPDDFFGRASELRILKQALRVGSVAIHGAIGIGKSSLLARTLLEMEGFGSKRRDADAVTVVGHKDVETIDDAARLVLERLVFIDEKKKTIKFKIGSFFEHESGEVFRNFENDRHLAALQKLLEKESLNAVLKDKKFLIIAVDEADKCPVPLAQLIRAITTQVQLEGIKSVRFLAAGVSGFYEKMIGEDQGLTRFIYKTVSLEPMSVEDATDLVVTKLSLVAEDARQAGNELEISSDIIPRMVALSGGHPHILQLLGSYVVEHEDEDPDGIIDSKDLLSSLTTICYQDRAQAYDATLHMLTLEQRLEDFQKLLSLAENRFPTRIPRREALELVGTEPLQWFTEHDILSVAHDNYGLVDEFLRIRILFDSERNEEDRKLLESRIIDETSTEEFAEAEFFESDDDDLHPPMYEDPEMESDED
jgi:hypothetical protein